VPNGNTGANPGLSRNCDREVNSQTPRPRCGWKVGGIVDPGARTPIGATKHSIETRGDVIMFERAVMLGVALAATGGGAISASTDPPTTAQTRETFAVENAENFSLSYADDHKVLTIGTGGDAETFVLVQRGTAAPELEGDLADAVVIDVPVATMFSGSSSHYGFIDELDIEATVTGVGDTSLIVTPSLAERAAAGEIESFSPNFVVDPEIVVAADPDVYVTGGVADPTDDVIREAGIPVVPNLEWLETTPEGWAEWIGVFAALTNTEARANELYGQWLADYDAAAAIAADVAERPTVITGGLFEGTWYSSGGGGIVAEFIADAGGDYVYADDPPTGSIELDIETVLADGADADVWLLPQGFTTREQAVTTDERLDDFAAWDVGGVWTNQVPVDPNVNFLERGPVMIDEYLLDYVAVLHPELVPDHELVFLSEVPPS
jgi:iron complex transport system substrate-binding protein